MGARLMMMGMSLLADSSLDLVDVFGGALVRLVGECLSVSSVSVDLRFREVLALGVALLGDLGFFPGGPEALGFIAKSSRCVCAV